MKRKSKSLDMRRQIDMKNKHIFFTEESEKTGFKKSRTLSKVCITFAVYLQTRSQFVTLAVCLQMRTLLLLVVRHQKFCSICFFKAFFCVNEIYRMGNLGVV